MCEKHSKVRHELENKSAIFQRKELKCTKIIQSMLFENENLKKDLNLKTSKCFCHKDPKVFTKTEIDFSKDFDSKFVKIEKQIASMKVKTVDFILNDSKCAKIPKASVKLESKIKIPNDMKSILDQLPNFDTFIETDLVFDKEFEKKFTKVESKSKFFSNFILCKKRQVHPNTTQTCHQKES